jgi:hypothetical protein
MSYKMYALLLLAGTSSGLSSGNLSCFAEFLNKRDIFQTPQSPRIQKPVWTGTDVLPDWFEARNSALRTVKLFMRQPKGETVSCCSHQIWGERQIQSFALQCHDSSSVQMHDTRALQWGRMPHARAAAKRLSCLHHFLTSEQTLRKPKTFHPDFFSLFCFLPSSFFF